MSYIISKEKQEQIRALLTADPKRPYTEIADEARVAPSTVWRHAKRMGFKPRDKGGYHSFSFEELSAMGKKGGAASGLVRRVENENKTYRR